MSMNFIHYAGTLLLLQLSGWQDSNLRPHRPKRCVITWLHYIPKCNLSNRQDSNLRAPVPKTGEINLSSTTRICLEKGIRTPGRQNLIALTGFQDQPLNPTRASPDAVYSSSTFVEPTGFEPATFYLPDRCSCHLS